MSSAANVRGTAATASSSARAESAATRVLARGDSTASHASVPSLLRQTFFDEVQHRDYRRCGSSASVALSDRSRQPAAAAAVPPPPPLSSVAHHPLRRLARHLDTDFFAEAATAEDAARDSADAVTRVAARSCSDSSSSTTSSNGSRHITVDPSPPPAVAVAVAAVRHIGEESAFNPTTSTAAPRQHHVRSATAAAALPFAERYAASDNPYLRAAAVELTGVHVADTSGGEAPWAAEMIGATRVAPRLARPVAEALTAAPSSSPPIRGIPLFTATHRPARWAAATSDGGGAAVVSAAAAAAAAAPMESLRQSWEDYGRVQLQDEALGWLHRCRVLEQELARLQDAHHRQSRLLAAHWPRHDVCHPPRRTALPPAPMWTTCRRRSGPPLPSRVDHPTLHLARTSAPRHRRWATPPRRPRVRRRRGSGRRTTGQR
ncbi:hypothetical protein NESM_000640200 [Novymonas esmeraldas]|uniref:Uncharacterized protein n=1 Tax=Novymonas esmeraldas TaxID=1808958 RepID=A0AAW0ETW2_9TRYP